MIRIEQFNLKDAEYLRSMAIEDLHQDFHKWAKMNVQSGPAYAGYIDNELVCAAGIRLYEKKLGVIWAVFTSAVKEHKLSVFKSIKVWIKLMMKEFELKELWAESKKGFPASQRLLKHLGFVLDSESDDYYFYKLKVGK